MKPLRPLLLVLLSLLAACDGSDPLVPDRRGTIRVSLVLSGLDLDPDGALVRLDGRAPAAVATGAAVTFTADPGVHTLLLEGLTDNCGAPDGVSQLVEVQEGNQTDALFTATCVAASGVVQVWIFNQGSDPDPNGYLVAVDDGVPQRAMGGTTVRFAPVPAGLHSITLSDVAANCALLPENPITGVEVTTGGPVRDTATVGAVVTCSSSRGSLLLVTSTSGPPDPDGYVLTMGDLARQTYRLGANDSLLLPGLIAGPLSLFILDVAGNCAPVPPVPASVSVPGGDTAVARFSVSCVDPAVVRVAAPTTGASLDPGYQVRVDGGSTTLGLLAGETLTLNLVPGNHTIGLEDIASNCTVGVATPATVSLSSAAPTDLVFPVSCVAVSRTGIDFTVTTTGPDPDLAYHLTVCSAADEDCFFPVLTEVNLPASTTLQVDLPPGTYLPLLGDIADNCRPAWTGAPTVISGQVTSVRVDVTCVALADFLATASVTGSDMPPGFYLAVDGRDQGYFPAFQPIRFRWYQGDHTVELAGMPDNCHAVSDNPLRVTLVAGVVTPLGFQVACEPFPLVQISVGSSGTNVPADYLIVIDPDPIDGFNYYSSPITANGTITTPVNLGSHQVWLNQLPSNCSVSGPNPVTVNGGLGSTTEVTFLVTCR